MVVVILGQMQKLTNLHSHSFSEIRYFTCLKKQLLLFSCIFRLWDKFNCHNQSAYIGNLVLLHA